MAKPNILIIYTGGTIGMIKDPKSGTLHPLDFKYLQNNIPELQLLDCKIKTIAFKNPIDSSDMNPSYWVEIANSIGKHYDRYDGFVVLHGSDTMSYTAAALSFMLENLNKPVILTGSQLPIGDLRTDAKENLITSIQIASLKKRNSSVIKEVCLYFEYKLYRGNRTTKINAEHFEAFASLNYPALAESGVHLKINEAALLSPKGNKTLKVHTNFSSRIAVLKLFPGITEAVLKAICEIDGLQGLILETYGAGNATTESWFIENLGDLHRKGVPIVNVTQCSGGSVNMGQYDTSAHLKKLGVISGKDISTEAAIAKLMYLVGLGLKGRNLKKEFETPLRGEMT